MLSTTWNAPLEAFGDTNQFFDNKDVDGVFFAFHKAQQFIGLEKLPTFNCHDVKKNPEINNDLKRYTEHLDNIF